MYRQLYSHQMVTIGKDVLAIGGYASGWGYSKSLFQFGCSDHDCEWTVLDQELKIGRQSFVAMAIPEELTKCS